jgi:hypothetical protein
LLAALVDSILPIDETYQRRDTSTQVEIIVRCLIEAPIIAPNKSLIRANARYLETDTRCAFSSTTTPPGSSPSRFTRNAVSADIAAR